MDSRLMSTKEAAEFLNVSTRTIYNYTSQGLLKAYKFKRKLYFFRIDLESLISGSPISTKNNNLGD